MSERLALAGRIRASLDDIKTTINRAIRLAEKGRQSGDDLITGGDGTDVCIGGPGSNAFVACETETQ
jgi:hypothetical protein